MKLVDKYLHTIQEISPGTKYGLKALGVGAGLYGVAKTISILHKKFSDKYICPRECKGKKEDEYNICIAKCKILVYTKLIEKLQSARNNCKDENCIEEIDKQIKHANNGIRFAKLMISQSM